VRSALRKRLTEGVSANLFAQVVTVVIQVVSVTVLLRFWGKDLFGEWLIISVVPIYLVIGGVGFSSVGGSEMTMLVAQGRRREALEVFQSLWAVMCGLSVALASLVLTFLLIVRGEYLIAWLHFSSLSASEISLIVIAFLAYVMLNLQEGLLDAGFRCEGNYALGVVLFNFTRLIEWSLLFLVVALGATPVGAAFALLGGRLLGAILEMRWLWKKSSWLVYSFKHAKYATIKRLLKPTSAFILFPVGEVTILQGMLIVVGAVLGPAAVAIFSTYRTLTRLAVQASGLIYRAASPEISAAYGVGNLNLARKLYYDTASLGFWVSLIAALLVMVSAGWFIPLWTDGAIHLDYLLLYLLLGAAITDSLWQTGRTVLVSANRHIYIAVVYLMVTAVAIFLSYVAMSVFGVVAGAALGLLVSNLIMIPCATRGALEMLRGNVSPYVLRLLLPLPMLVRDKGKSD
jgi:O-antigen/teichoic acid export membrane protein